jgi:hypothetical protein
LSVLTSSAYGHSQSGNSKSEYRNPKQIQNRNDSMTKTGGEETSLVADGVRITRFCHLHFCHSHLFRIWCFGFRILRRHAACAYLAPADSAGPEWNLPGSVPDGLIVHPQLQDQLDQAFVGNADRVSRFGEVLAVREIRVRIGLQHVDLPFFRHAQVHPRVAA